MRLTDMSLSVKREYYFTEYQEFLKACNSMWSFEEFLLDRLAISEYKKEQYKKFILEESK